jgi:two-component system, sensor histidine kinase
MARGHVVLVVEDEEPNRALLRAVMAHASDERLRDVTLLEAPDLASARAILATNHVDLVLLDVRLPDGNGLSLIMDESGRQDLAPPFVVLSASVLPTERAAALAMGAAGFMAKPYRSADLVAAVAELLGPRPVDAS